MCIEDKVKEILTFVFELDNNYDFETLSIDTNSKWDSMKQVTIITALENEFDIFMEADEAAQLTSYNKIINYITNNS